MSCINKCYNNINMNKIFILFLLIIIISVVFPKVEKFTIKRKRRKGRPIQLGFLNNTPGPIKSLMKMLNKIGLQMDADKEHDNVASDYLDKDKIK